MATITTPTSTTPTVASGPARWNIWVLGAVAGVAAAAAAAAVAAVALGLGVPMEVAPASATAAEQIPLAGFVSLTIPSVLVGTVLAATLARWSKRPAPVFLVVTIVLTLASFALPHTTSYATAATRITLDLTHVAAALAFIPVMAWRLTKVPARS